MTAFSTAPLPGPFGLEVSNINLITMVDADLKELLLMLYANRFLVLRTGGLSKQEFVTFARRVGDPIQLSNNEEYPEIASLTNIDTDTRVEKRGAAHWHSDQSFTKHRSSVTMLYSVQAPKSSGETRFCDLTAAYETLPEDRRQLIDELIVEHRLGVSVAARPGDHIPIPPKGWDQSRSVFHPLVREHPVTGLRTLYAITGTSQGIQSMPLDDAVRLLTELCEHAFQDQFVTSHRHAVNDLVMWGNPTTLHSASPIGAATGPDDTRVIHRISLKGTPSVFT
ncbi:MAG: TauD/TfdA family dioxygenase [Pseudomonadales bacterium]|jgi:taurine dioxygenase|nr:TauD/TfdA family dioxygenase [Pseudomonadales bacterium]MDP7596781.1 TauD/TfdA family dioxygenase [Pseudomonadales bacterium]HJN51599.1 TauD/TfdA family dioxygenase [Pseudomonadales bacterium]|tara:strand:- start:670 stop:1512 length:843 start_codon:yes stop_codon:yes gene_type:complete